jgi:hypothetical protein
MGISAAQACMLMVAAGGAIRLTVSSGTPALFLVDSMVTGRVALEEQVEKATSMAGKMFLKC